VTAGEAVHWQYQAWARGLAVQNAPNPVSKLSEDFFLFYITGNLAYFHLISTWRALRGADQVQRGGGGGYAIISNSPVATALQYAAHTSAYVTKHDNLEMPAGYSTPADCWRTLSPV